MAPKLVISFPEDIKAMNVYISKVISFIPKAKKPITAIKRKINELLTLGFSSPATSSLRAPAHKVG
jgi:hypothetical protein